MKKYLVTAAFAALALAAARPALADDAVQFDPTGTGTSFSTITGIDWQQGNGIAVGANLGSNQNSTFTVYFQAQLSVPNTSIDQQIPGPAGRYFTVVAGFRETISSPTGSDPITFGFVADPNQPNFFAIYAHDNPSFNLTGAGFVDGTQILVGHIVGDKYSSTFDITSLVPEALDQTPIDGNNYPGQTTIAGSGTSTIRVAVDGYNTNYFRGLGGATITTVVNSGTGTAIPFNNVDPSACFFASGSVGDILRPSCTGAGVPNHTVGSTTYLGTGPLVGVGLIDGNNDGNFTQVNGFNSTSTMLKIDANSSFEVVGSPVPEPATLGLLGFGLLGAVAAGRRLRRKQ